MANTKKKATQAEDSGQQRATFGTFERDGSRRVAHSPADAVKFRFDGWREVVDDTGPAAAASSTGGTGDVAGDTTSTKKSTNSK